MEQTGTRIQLAGLFFVVLHIHSASLTPQESVDEIDKALLFPLL